MTDKELLARIAEAAEADPDAEVDWVLAQLDAARAGDGRAQQWENDVRATIDHLRALLDERTGVPHAS